MSTLRSLVSQCRSAAHALGQLSAAQRSELIESMAAALETDAERILAANHHDIEAARAKGIGSAMLDRLALNPQRLAGVAQALREVAALPDPVGEITQDYQRPNGLRVQKIRLPLGVIAMIYEARPNVTADAAALCIKAGNGVVLRGGSEAIHSNTAIAASLRRALAQHGIDPAALTLIEDLRRETMLELLQLNDLIDLAIPRGGEGLIRFVAEHARVPVIKHYKGVCHMYVDDSADISQAVDLLIDGKVSRPAACNALETLLVHADIAESFLPQAAEALAQHQVELRGDERARQVLPSLKAATEEDYAAEYLDLILAVRVVDDIDQAIAHIQHYTSDHTEVIATTNTQQAEKFVQALRSAVVMVNASSRFSDGGELGLGAEIGISTTRLHAYGPMGLQALTVERFVVRGSGQVRH